MSDRDPQDTAYTFTAGYTPARRLHSIPHLDLHVHLERGPGGGPFPEEMRLEAAAARIIEHQETTISGIYAAIGNDDFTRRDLLRITYSAGTGDIPNRLLPTAGKALDSLSRVRIVWQGAIIADIVPVEIYVLKSDRGTGDRLTAHAFTLTPSRDPVRADVLERRVLHSLGEIRDYIRSHLQVGQIIKGNIHIDLFKSRRDVLKDSPHTGNFPARKGMSRHDLWPTEPQASGFEYDVSPEARARSAAAEFDVIRAFEEHLAKNLQPGAARSIAVISADKPVKG